MKSIFITQSFTVQSLCEIGVKFASGGEKKRKPKKKKTSLSTSTAARKESQEDRCRVGEDIQRLRIASITVAIAFWHVW